MAKKASILFEIEPDHWGYRGDPYLWKEMKELFEKIYMPCSTEDFKEYYLKFFEQLTGHNLDENIDLVVLDKYKHGGMTSGGICFEYWREKFLYLLIERLESYNKECI